MAVPEQQLQTWCNQGATVTAQATYASVQAALAAPAAPIRGKPFDVFLQGSYRSATNIYGDSDVDIVVQYKDTWGRDLSLLPPPQVQLYTQTYPNATYSWQQFRADVLASLTAYYGAANLIESAKCLKLAAAPGRLVADVVPAITYKRFNYFLSDAVQDYVEGIRFHDRRDGREIVNYPKQHIENGQAKNGQPRTGGNYKPIVRMFKNARTYIVDHHMLPAAAPSYFVECMLYNVPDHLLVANRQQAMRGIVEWLRDNDGTFFMCQNGVTFLFGPTPEQWNIGAATGFADALINLWNNW